VDLVCVLYPEHVIVLLPDIYDNEEEETEDARESNALPTDGELEQ
jgi:hypothetical protein